MLFTILEVLVLVWLVVERRLREWKVYTFTADGEPILGPVDPCEGAR